GIPVERDHRYRSGEVPDHSPPFPAYHRRRSSLRHGRRTGQPHRRDLVCGRIVIPRNRVVLIPGIDIRRMCLRVLVTLLAFLALGSRLSAQVRPVPEEKEQTAFLLIDHFGKLIEDRDGIETFKWISKGLQLRLDSTFIYGDSALIANDDRVHAYGNGII